MADDVATAAPAGALVPVDDPALVLTDQKRFDDFFDRIAAEARGLKADVKTKRGRDAIASMAYKVARTKTAIDDAGKKLTEDARTQIAKVDQHRRQMREKLDNLRDEVRAPLDKWQEDENARVAQVDCTMQALRQAAVVNIDATAAGVQEAIAALEAMTFAEDVFLDEIEAAHAARDAALVVLRAAATRLQREEADRAELARLRAEREEREAEERLRQEEAEAQRRAREEAEAAAAREAAERRQREESVARAAREAEERARREAEERAAAEQAERDRQHQESLAAERRAREEAEAEARRERERREADERQRQETQRRQQEEDARRATDRAHRGEVMRAAKEALMEHATIDEDTAKRVVLAIAAGSVPAVSIKF